jgi:hypothetical protein
LAWSRVGARTRRVAGESTEVVLARDKDRLEIVETWDISEEFEPRLEEPSWYVGLRGGNVGVGVGVGVCCEEVLRVGSGGRPGKVGGLSTAESVMEARVVVVVFAR